MALACHNSAQTTRDQGLTLFKALQQRWQKNSWACDTSSKAGPQKTYFSNNTAELRLCFFCCHLSLHSCTLESAKNLQKKCERKFAGKSIRRWQEKRSRHSHLKTLSNAPAGTSTSLGDQATSMFTAGTVTATIPSLSVSALAP